MFIYFIEGEKYKVLSLVSNSLYVLIDTMYWFTLCSCNATYHTNRKVFQLFICRDYSDIANKEKSCFWYDLLILNCRF